MTLAIASGLLIGFCLLFFNYWIAWFAIVPLLLLIDRVSIKESFFYGFLSGFIQGTILLYWVVVVVQNFSGTNTLWGIPLLLIGSAYFGLCLGLFSVLFKKIKSFVRDENPFTEIFYAASLWILIEWVRLNILTGMPWLHYIMAFTQTTNEYLIQTASIWGDLGISFLVVLVNAAIYKLITKRDLKFLYFFASILVLNFLYGYVIANQIEQDSERTVKFSIINENFSAQTRWMETSGDSLSNILFELNREAIKTNPDFILWSETTVPWILEDGDDLLEKILKITAPSNSSHIAGYMLPTRKKSKEVYDSALLIGPDGKVTGVYNKVDLLSAIEKPFIDFDFLPKMQIPFFTSTFFESIKSGEKRIPLRCKKGEIGVLICNESLLPHPTEEAVENGAEIIVVLSNDSWFTTGMLKFHHFYISKLRAVFTRRDIVINSNMGYSGIIYSSGKDIKSVPSEKPQTLSVESSFYNTNTIYTKYGSILIFIIILINTLNHINNWRKR